jgi:hypothetical protein
MIGGLVALLIGLLLILVLGAGVISAEYEASHLALPQEEPRSQP